MPGTEDDALVVADAMRKRHCGGRLSRRPALRRLSARLMPLVGQLVLIASQLVLMGCLTAAGTALAQTGTAEDQLPIVVTADQIVFDTEKKQTTAVGNAEVSRGERRLIGDSIRYDERTGKVFAKGNIVLIEANGDAIFGDEMEITGDLRDGVVKGVRALLADDIRIAGVKGRRLDGNTTILEKAVYSPCKLCADGSPSWQIRADRAVHDEADQDFDLQQCRDAGLRHPGGLYALVLASGPDREASARAS